MHKNSMNGNRQNATTPEVEMGFGRKVGEIPFNPKALFPRNLTKIADSPST
jgi:hypothetical protein